MRSLPRRLGASLIILSMISLGAALSDARAQVSDGAAVETRTGFSGLPVPRFVALKKDKVFGRAGPDQDVVVVYRRKSLPVKVIAESSDNVWRRVEDHEGRRVWIHRKMLQENNHAILQSPSILFAEPTDEALPRARLEAGVMARLDTCSGAWCRVRTRHYAGWIDRQNLWGPDL